jgi:polyhydroxybutyrate depolymerase
MRQNRFLDDDNRPRLVAVIGIIISALLFLSIAIYAFTARQSLLPQTGSHLPISIPALPAQPPVVTCTTPQHAPGDRTGSITSGGLKRTFLVHLPPGYGVHPLPLILLYHGYSWTAQIMEQNSNMAEESDRAGFVLVFPQGVDSPPSWNAGVGTGDADDIGFTRDLLSSLEKNYCVNKHRVYLSGFSLGGGMVYRLGCTLTDQIAAIATVSGAYYPIPGGCHPSRPLPVLEIHGAADTLAPYGGNPDVGMAAVQSYLNGWLERDKCNAISNVFFQQGDVTGIEWTHCATGVAVVHYRVSDGGHTWPGTPHTTHVIDADVVLWQFFNRFSLAE